MMLHCNDRPSIKSQLGGLFLWIVAITFILSVHAMAGYYLMQSSVREAVSAPPAAIMIELAAIPEAINTEDITESNDQIDQAEVQSPSTPTIEEQVEVTPEPQPEPEPVIEDVPDAPIEELVEPLLEEVTEPVEDIDPLDNEILAALENVEVPLPTARPPPEKRIETADIKKKTISKQKLTPQVKPKKTPPAVKAQETAKANVNQSNRNASSSVGASNGSNPASIKQWETKVRSAISRRQPRSLRGGNLTGSVSFYVSASGSITSVNMIRSTGDGDVDRKILAWISSVRSVPKPPMGAKQNLTLPISIR